jgi:RNA polymerase sigma-70 factor (ECF subfamily)
LVERSNQQWTADLSELGPTRDAALGDLRAELVRGLRYAMARHREVTDADIEDFAQEALLKVLSGLPSFRGESRFTTWAHKIAVHVAYTELRRRRWRDVALDQPPVPAGGLHAQHLADPSAQTEKHAMQQEILVAMRRALAEELTERQYQAFVAVRVMGMPMEQVAGQMNMNRNALYKLLFDARRKLKRSLLTSGFSAQDVLSAFADTGA